MQMSQHAKAIAPSNLQLKLRLQGGKTCVEPSLKIGYNCLTFVTYIYKSYFKTMFG